jgi:acyl-CoA synthetase (AMP-forming)/AMP-acid ligase II
MLVGCNVTDHTHWKTTFGLLTSRAAKSAQDTAVVDVAAGKTLNFTDLLVETRKAAAAFMAQGVVRGDRVAIWAPNFWEWIVAALGLQAAGAALVPLNTRFKGAEAAYILRRSRAKVLVMAGRFLETDYPALLADEECSDLQCRIVLRGSAPGALDWDTFIASGSDIDPEERMASVEADDTCDILFTSGTTGHPKGVICTHAQTLQTFCEWSRIVGLNARDRYLIVNPFFHAFGYKAGWLASIIVGATSLPHYVFDPAEVFERIPRDGVTMLPGPPALYQSLLAQPNIHQQDLSSLRLAVTGAAVIPTSLIVSMRDVLGFETVITGYGLTESCGVATMCRFDDDPETIARTSGRAIDETEVRIVDDDGVALEPGEQGEIVVRGYNVMKGYLDDAEATAAAIDSRGWLKTGDIGVMDEKGYLRITDRKKDMFIVGGFNAYPAEIENALLLHPEVAQVAVVGADDDRLGEVGVAFVVRFTGSTLSADELMVWSRDQMANYKVPRQVYFLKELPRNALGKVTRYILKEQLRSP